MRDGEGWLGTHVVAELAHEGGKVVVVFFCFFIKSRLFIDYSHETYKSLKFLQDWVQSKCKSSQGLL